MSKLQSQKDYEDLREQFKKERDSERRVVSLCAGSGCGAYGTKGVRKALEQEVLKNGLKEKVEIKVTGCHGFCEQGPILVIYPEGIFYPKVKPEDVPEIVAKTIVNGEVIENKLYKDPLSKKRISKEKDVPFYRQQLRIVFGNNGLIDPTNIDDYIAMDGYFALVKALFSMSPEEVISAIKESGLRGRGGGGFPNRNKVGDLLQGSWGYKVRHV